MDLLEFARGPALTFSLAVFVLGVAWRLYGIFRRPPKADFSSPRSTALARGALRAIWVRMFPRREFGSPGLTATVNAYAYHIGIALVVFAFAPHIGFVQRLTGLHWPALPDAVTYIATAVAIVTLIIALVNRMTDGVLRLLSNFDDYFTWIVTMLPLATGMALIERPYVPAPIVAPELPTTPELLAIHLLSLELMLLWFPFGKLSHAILVFVSRARTGAEFARKGAAQ
ncbi:MAG: hypothetical protein HYX46_10945 [Betaproteobacteria bacterium]|nr:hypothetical protein [Betaproteobacteria bacterium]